MAHHDVVKRIIFNPKRRNEFATASADHAVKIFEIRSLNAIVNGS